MITTECNKVIVESSGKLADGALVGQGGGTMRGGRGREKRRHLAAEWQLTGIGAMTYLTKNRDRQGICRLLADIKNIDVQHCRALTCCSSVH
jgi:hypothetical protein